MSQTQTEGTNLAVAPETTLGTQAAAGWINLQPNNYGDVGPSTKKVARTPISQNRQNQKPIVVDLDSAVPYTCDLTKDVVDAFLSGLMMSAVKHSGGTGLSLFRPTAVTATGYTVAALGNVQTGTLIVARGFGGANDGLKLTTASIATEIKAAGLVVNAAPPANATVDVAGFQATVAADIQMDVNGNLTSTAANFTTMGLNVGQWIWVGGALGTAFVFANTAYRGFARIKTIAATLLTLERRSWTVGGADVAAGKTIQLFWSRWARNVALNHADALKPSFSFEITYPDLGGVGVPKYEYPLGNLVDEWNWNLSLTDKATLDLKFTGTTTPVHTVTRATGAATALNPVTQLAASTAVDLARLRISNVDETGVTTDFKSVKITFKNNVNPEKVLGALGAAIMSLGRFEVMVEAEVLFTASDVVDAIRDNRTITMDFGVRNTDFGLLIDVMAASMDEGDRNFPTNQTVTIKAKSTGFQDPTLGSTAGVSVFGFLPVG